jgi:hypothetical protein
MTLPQIAQGNIPFLVQIKRCEKEDESLGRSSEFDGSVNDGNLLAAGKSV